MASGTGIEDGFGNRRIVTTLGLSSSLSALALFIYNAEIFCFAEIFCLAEIFCFAEFFCLEISAGAEIFCSKSLRQKISVLNSCPNEMSVWSLPGWPQLGNS